MENLEPKYKRILLKLSGEALAGGAGHGIDFDTVMKICEPVKKCVDLGAEIAIVVGGGNFWRGRSSGEMERTRADHIGMLGTVMNAIAVADCLEKCGVSARATSSIEMPQIAETYIRDKAVHQLEKGRVVIFGGGTGNPFFSTDTCAALRAAEIGADIIFKATMVDGVYDSDPKKNPNAKKFEEISLSEVLDRELKVMDATCAALCRENGIGMVVFDLGEPENIYKIVCGEKIGTVVTV